MNQNQLAEPLHYYEKETQLAAGLEMNAAIPLEVKNFMYLPLNFDNNVKRNALIDTKASAIAMPGDFHEKLRETLSNSLSDLE